MRCGNSARKSRRLSTILLAAVCVVPLAAQSSPEQLVADLANQDRAQQGLPSLTWDPALAAAATQHAELMAQQPALSHQYEGEQDLASRAGSAGAHFRSIAENVAMAPSPQALETEWMHSAPHRANILDPHYNTIGIGIVKKNGYYYAVEDFAEGVSAMSPEAIESTLAHLLEQRGVAVVPAKQDARQTCEMDHGVAGGSQPRFVMRWEGSDLSRLPDVLERRLANQPYHSAAVGACDSGKPSGGFTTYKVAVLLY